MRRHRRPAQLGREADAEEIPIFGSRDGYLIGARGRPFIDFTSGWCVGNFGWDARGIRVAMRNFKGPTYVYPGYRYQAWDDLAALLGDLTPGNLTHCFRATGGSEAVDLALQAAMLHTGRRKFISLEDSYHGNTIGALSVGSGDRDRLPNLLGHATVDRSRFLHSARKNPQRLTWETFGRFVLPRRGTYCRHNHATRNDRTPKQAARSQTSSLKSRFQHRFNYDCSRSHLAQRHKYRSRNSKSGGRSAVGPSNSSSPSDMA